MNKYTVDVMVLYTQTIEVEAASEQEAKATALDRFEVNDAQQTHSTALAFLEETT